MSHILHFSGANSIIPSDESPTGYLFRLSASCCRETRYEIGVPVNPASGDDIARADFEAQDQLIDYHRNHCSQGE